MATVWAWALGTLPQQSSNCSPAHTPPQCLARVSTRHNFARAEKNLFFPLLFPRPILRSYLHFKTLSSSSSSSSSLWNETKTLTTKPKPRNGGHGGAAKASGVEPPRRPSQTQGPSRIFLSPPPLPTTAAKSMEVLQVPKALPRTRFQYHYQDRRCRILQTKARTYCSIQPGSASAAPPAR